MVDTTFKIGMMITAVAAGAISEIGKLIKSTDSLSVSMAQVKEKLKIGGDIERLQGRLRSLEAAGNAGSAEHRRYTASLERMSERARAAGLDLANLGHEMSRLRVHESSLNMSTYGHTMSERGSQLRADARGQIMDSVAGGMMLAAPIIPAAKFVDQMKGIAITGDMTAAQEARIGQVVRENAVKYNQTHEALGNAVDVLVGKGMGDEAKLAAATPRLAKTATATRSDMGDLARTEFQLDLIGVKDMNLAFSQLALAGKLGSFELRDMSKWIPTMTGQYQALKIIGDEAVVNMSSRLQIATLTAGSNDEAANNFKNFLSKLTSSDTAKDFAKQGIDLRGTMDKAALNGKDAIEAGIGATMSFLASKSPEAEAELKKLAKQLDKIKDPAERAAEMERRGEFIKGIGDKFNLGGVFQDIQAVSYLLAEIQNRDKLKEMQAKIRTGKNNEGKDVIEADYARRMGSPIERMNSLKIGMTDVGISIGEALLPPLMEIGEALVPVLKGMGDFAKAHPEITKLAMGTVAMAVGFSIAGMAVKWLFGGLLSLASPAVRFAGWMMRIGPIVSVATQASVWLGAAWFGLGRGSLVLGGILRGVFLIGIRMAGQAVLVLGRALMVTPIGLLATGIAVAGYFIYKNWSTIGPMIQRGLAQSKTSLGGFWDSIKGLPTKFYRLGSDLMTGLSQGIEAFANKPVESIEAIGASVAGAFKSLLGIHSPSRVFMGFGDNIGQGAALGIEGSLPRVQKAVNTLAKAPLNARLSNAIAAGAERAHVQGGAQGAGGGAITVHFSPTINVSGGGDVGEQMRAAMPDIYREFESNMKRFMADQQRRAY